MIMTEGSPRTNTTSSFSVTDILNPTAQAEENGYKAKQIDEEINHHHQQQQQQIQHQHQQQQHPSLTTLGPYRTSPHPQSPSPYLNTQPPGPPPTAPPSNMASMGPINSGMSPYNYVPQIPAPSYPAHYGNSSDVGAFTDMRNPSAWAGYPTANSNYSSRFIQILLFSFGCIFFNILLIRLG